MPRPDGGEALRLFGEYQRRRNFSPGTIRNRRFRVLSFADWLDKDVLEATTEDVEKWLDTHDLAPRTRYTYIAYLAAFFGFCHKQRIIRRDPTEDVVRPKMKKSVPRPWDESDIAYALTQADPRMRCFLLLPHLAGARCMGMANLQVEDIHRDQGVILLHEKGNKERLVPLHPAVLDALTAYGLPRAGYVFRRPDGKPLRPSTISKYVSTFLHGLGIDATAHMGRHAFGTNFYRASNGDILMTADVMGHESVVTTQIYAKWWPELAGKVVEQLTLPLFERERALTD